MDTIVKKWRKTNPAIVALQGDLESCAMRAIETRKPVRSIHKGLLFECNGEVMTIKLPSGRRLFYQSPSFAENKWGKKSIRYKGMDQTTKQWGWVDTYGGKITENVIQAIARDLLADAMQRVEAAGLPIVMTVHDEIVCELELNKSIEQLKIMADVMCIKAEWSHDLPLRCDVEIPKYYKK